MGALKEYFAAIERSVLTIGEGLAVTFSYMLRKPVTLQYPDRTEKPVVAMLPERSRGILEIDLDLCTACAMCGKTCPIDCIHIDTQKVEGGGRLLSRMDVEIGKCMFCGLCVEVCPTGAIRHSHEFEGGMGYVDSLMLHFVREPRPPAKPPKKGEPVNFKPLGSIVRGILPNAWDKPVIPIPGKPPAAASVAPAKAPPVVSKEATAESTTPQSNKNPQGTPPANGGEKS